MRKINYLILLLVFGIFHSCNEENSVTGESTKEVINAKKMEFTGIEHNQMLEEVYQFLKSNSRVSTRAKSSSDRVVDLKEFLINKISSNTKYADKSNEMAVNYIKAVFSSSDNFSSSNKVLTRGSSVNDYSNLLSEKENVYLEKLDKILTNVSLKDSNIVSRIVELEKCIESNNKLSNRELTTLLSATSTAKYSYNYWSENIEKWKDLRSKNALAEKSIKTRSDKKDGSNSKSERDGDQSSVAGDIIKADVGGAVGGAVGAAVVNVIPGAGQVAYGSAIIGGAVAGSVGTGVVKLLDWLF